MAGYKGYHTFLYGKVIGSTIGRSYDGRPIGVTVHSDSVENSEDLMQRFVGKGLVAKN